MALGSASDLGHLWAERAAFYGPIHQEMDKLVGVYHGNLPQEFSDFFHEEMNVHLINMIRLAWDDIAALAGKEFPILVESDNEKPTAKARAERQEKIAYGWNRAGQKVAGISMKTLMRVVMWWMAGCANAVLMALPDYERKTPYFTFRDPRHHYPPVGWTPFTQAMANDALFAYQMSMAELKARYPGAKDELDQKLTKRRFSRRPFKKRAADDETFVWVGEFYTDETWMVATLTDAAVTLERSDQGDPGHPGVMPVTSFGLYSPGLAKGRSMFSDQVSIQAAMARMFSQKLDFFDRTLYPFIFHTPLTGKTVRVGPFALNEFDLTSHPNTSPRVDVIAPQNPVDADQTIQMAAGLMRMLNRNPEPSQGQAPSGRADSAKALETLMEGVGDTIRSTIWPPAVEALPSLYEKAARMDVELWGNTRKQAVGKRRNAAFKVNYIPNRDLRDREGDFEIEPGVGLAGYQGTLQLMQLVGAEMMSEDSALEEGEWVRNPQEERRKIDLMRLQRLEFTNLAAKAEGGMLPDDALAEIRKMVAEGKDLMDAIDELAKQGRLQPPAPPPGAGGAPGMAPPGAPGAVPEELAGLLPAPEAFGR